MKLFCFIIMIGSAFGDDDNSFRFKLNIENYESPNYLYQLKAGFGNILNKNKKLADKFHKMENPPPSETRGRYNGEPIIQIVVLAESENASFSENSGEKIFEKTIALYYRFDEGLHHGSKSNNGFFIVFTINGKLDFDVIDGNASKIKKSEVFAKFKEFSRSITFPIND